MKKISILDTTICSYNLGNEIIMESVCDAISELFPDDFYYSIPWEGVLSVTARRNINNSDYVFFGGTNSLSSHVLKYNQMNFRLRDLFQFDDLTLLGLGWWQYQNKPDLYTRMYLTRLLSNKNIHSVRDEYTKRKLIDIGVDNVSNTCCPTTWSLTDQHCSAITIKKTKSVVVTLTDYNVSRAVDEQLLDTLFDSYEYIYFWVQGVDDLKYIQSFDKHKNRILLIPPKLKKYDEFLETEDCDYIGTRLHAGIRAIQKKKRTLILAVDNRATEIAKDIGLNVKPRGNLSEIQSFISKNYSTKLNVPFDEINRWKAQFK